jgi:hypothetical protein
MEARANLTREGKATMTKVHSAIRALDDLKLFDGVHRAVCKEISYSPRVTQAFCPTCDRFLGEPINHGNDAYWHMLIHALDTFRNVGEASPQARQAIAAALEALQDLALEREKSVELVRA